MSTFSSGDAVLWLRGCGLVASASASLSVPLASLRAPNDAVLSVVWPLKASAGEPASSPLRTGGSRGPHRNYSTHLGEKRSTRSEGLRIADLRDRRRIVLFGKIRSCGPASPFGRDAFDGAFHRTASPDGGKSSLTAAARRWLGAGNRSSINRSGAITGPLQFGEIFGICGLTGRLRARLGRGAGFPLQIAPIEAPSGRGRGSLRYGFLVPTSPFWPRLLDLAPLVRDGPVAAPPLLLN